ncbi:MAG TPA: ABC transporter permease [Candidatus Saccharimonadales bacterium]|nr:ABC transporter permease [Candidatus Saccharimonadales bacterium]
MRVYRTFKTAMRALRRNVMRAGLTTLGIVIGVAAVIAMMEIGNGSALAIQHTIATMGAYNLMVFPGNAMLAGISTGTGGSMMLSPGDADAILTDCPSVTAAAPVVWARAQAVYNNLNWQPGNLLGTTPSFLDVRDWSEMAQGNTFTDRDVRNCSKVCVIGKTIVKMLFQDEPPVGKEIRLMNVNFKVVGVLKAKGANMMGSDQDDVILAPWTTIKYRVSAVSSTATVTAASTTSILPSQVYPAAQASVYPVPSASQQTDTPQPVRFANVNEIVVAARSAGEVTSAIDEITALLRERHHVRPGMPEDFTIRDMTEMVRTMSSTTELMTTLLLIVAAISLVVGGVGIMNIMLVSVTERTREIGLRMAVGAHSGDILHQFLMEAIVLCLIGGAIGIGLGRATSVLVRLIKHWPTVVSLGAIAVAVAVSALVGVLFGFYPAWKASRLDPIDALRYE